MVISAKISKRSPVEYGLVSEGAEIGWLRPGVMTFCGYPTVDLAREAGNLATEMLSAWYETRWRVRAPLAWSGDEPPDAPLVQDGVVVGRLLHACRPSRGGDESAGFELAVPRELWIATAVELAQRIHSALHDASLTARHARAAAPERRDAVVASA